MNMKQLRVNGRYFEQEGKPFFWLADTAWLIYANITEEEAYVYLKNRADKGFNVIQTVLVYSVDALRDINKMPILQEDVRNEAYWAHCDRVIHMAGELGLYMALVPCWGSLVMHDVLTMENAGRYAQFLAERYGAYDNVIWLLGGDINAEGHEEIYRLMGRILKEKCPHQLIGFHPFGRCASTLWFSDDVDEWLDFNMFQSGHRRYDQCNMGAWDDVTGEDTGLFGEDNWKFVLHDRNRSRKPTMDGEPSYEWILQGLHDPTQPYWHAIDVRRYAYWSAFAGAAGHTYGDCSIIMFYDPETMKAGRLYGARERWRMAMHHDGSGQMRYLKELMLSVDYRAGRAADELVIGGQREKHERIAVLAGPDFALAYSFLGKEFELDTSAYIGKDIYFMRPSTGVYSFLGKVDGPRFHYEPVPCYDGNDDVVIVIR